MLVFDIHDKMLLTPMIPKSRKTDCHVVYIILNESQKRPQIDGRRIIQSFAYVFIDSF